MSPQRPLLFCTSVWPDTEQALSEKLATPRSNRAAPYTERSSGFEPPTGTDGCRSHAASAARISCGCAIRLRVLPTAAVNEALDVRLAEYRKRMQEEPGRRTKRKLKEQTRDELLPKALLKSDRTTALFLLNENVLAIGTSSETRAPSGSSSSCASALGKLDTEPLDVRTTRRELSDTRVLRRAPPKFALGRECRMRDRAEAKGSVRWSEIDLTHANVRRCVKDGMELTHLGIEFDSALRGVLDANGALGKLKLVGLDEAADEAAEGTAAEDPLARLDAELALLGGTLRQLVVGLRQALDHG